MKKAVEVVFFDLDHTLWDYEANAYETLNEIFQIFDLSRGYPNADEFISAFRSFNHFLWDRYNKGEIDRKTIRSTRFTKILNDAGIVDSALGEEISDYFIDICPSKNNLIEGALDLLEYLSAEYRMAIITNGFTDTQQKKLNHGKIDHYFEEVVTSESSSARKPASEIFDFAMRKMEASTTRSIMVGDNISTDIAGAKNVGMKSIWYTDAREPAPDDCTKVHSLTEIQSLL